MKTQSQPPAAGQAAHKDPDNMTNAERAKAAPTEILWSVSFQQPQGYGKDDPVICARTELRERHAALVAVHTAANALLELMVLAPNANPPTKPYLRHVDDDPRLDTAMKRLFLAVSEASAACTQSPRAIEQSEQARAALAQAKEAQS